jgi:hypothetical protein
LPYRKAMPIPITPENAPPGTKVRCIRVDGSEGELNYLTCYVVDAWDYSHSIVRIKGEGPVGGWFADRFVLALDSVPVSGLTPAPGYKTENKPDYTYLCREMLDAAVRGLEYGGKKHGRLNYLTNPAVTDTELVAAMCRHALAATIDSDAVDAESGLPHATLAGVNSLMLNHRRAARKGTP